MLHTQHKQYTYIFDVGLLQSSLLLRELLTKLDTSYHFNVLEGLSIEIARLEDTLLLSNQS